MSCLQENLLTDSRFDDGAGQGAHELIRASSRPSALTRNPEHTALRLCHWSPLKWNQKSCAHARARARSFRILPLLGEVLPFTVFFFFFWLDTLEAHDALPPCVTCVVQKSPNGIALQVVDRAPIKDGESHLYCVAATGGPITVTLVWHDYPASTSAAKALVNDLDLSVRAAGLNGFPLLVRSRSSCVFWEMWRGCFHIWRACARVCVCV